MEIRVHGRGGQGGVTCAKIIAAVYSRLGKSVQSFGDYAGERSGAPVRAYTRIGDEPITNRNKVYRPNHLLVLDPTLLGDDTVSGLLEGGTLLVNTTVPPDALGDRFITYRVATVDATEIARRHGIGTRSVVIVNTTIAGAFVRMLGLPLDVLEKTYDHLGLRSNFAAASEAYLAVRVREARKTPARATPIADVVAKSLASRNGVLPLTEHVEGPPTRLETGSWRTQKPRYVHRLAPCNAWCPAGVDVIGFVETLARKGEAAAAAVLARTNPLAGVCGRLCPAPCMEGCNRREYDGAVKIRGLERWIADHATVAPVRPETNPKPRRIAVVGGGPGGLSAAYTLSRKGHRVTLFAAERALGGMLLTDVPSFRLPREILEREVAGIVDLGVEVRCAEEIDAVRLEELSREFEAVVLARGQSQPRTLNVPGASLTGVEDSARFLRRVNAGVDVKLAGHVIVLGGGTAAVDSARAALRAGALRVTLAYRRSGPEMPAIPEDVDAARDEGVEILYESQPVAIYGAGRVRGVEFAKVFLGAPDETGRRRPVVTDRRVLVDADGVIVALGSVPAENRSWLPQEWEIRDGRVFQGERALNVHLAGDLARGEGSVAHAIGDGRRAAGLALQSLGVDAKPFERPDRKTAVPVTDIRLDHFVRIARARESFEPAATRVRHFGEASHGLDDALEAHRCFSCGTCTRCDTCLVYCPEGIVRRRGQAYSIDYAYCKGCGVCVTECPRNAMEMVQE
ncbi:MAG: 2-oxoacid:acceptor oxidoreductase family protein [Planctomycetes bacterium]|nr:2-oxoacid:acceptor oxidoreductase family protein [Planctomycetota bacterium]MBI3844881.1 2-oxoacid:acceptor oxidoreductase family protein [Planctomycetota bacterium]